MPERGSIIISWGAGKRDPGINKGLEVFAKALAYYDEQVKTGRVSGYRVYASITGKQTGMLVVEGAIAELTKLMVETDNLKLLAAGTEVVEDLDIQLMAGGSADDVMQYIGLGLESIQENGL